MSIIKQSATCNELEEQQQQQRWTGSSWSKYQLKTAATTDWQIELEREICAVDLEKEEEESDNESGEFRSGTLGADDEENTSQRCLRFVM